MRAFAGQAVAVFFGIGSSPSLSGCHLRPILIVKYGMTSTALTLSAGAAGLGFYLPDLFVNRRRKKRAESIFLGLPDALDLMVVCVEAGLGLDAAMRRVTSELAQSSAVLCEEFAIANFQLQMGRSRRDVLHDGTGPASTTCERFAAVVIQSRNSDQHQDGLASIRCHAAAAARHLAEERPPRPRSRS